MALVTAESSSVSSWVRIGKRALSILAGLVILISVQGCNKDIRVDDGDLVFVARPEFQEALDDVDAEKEDHMVVVDPRRVERYQAGHISTAINIPLPKAVANDVRIRRAKVIYVYGEYGHDPLAMAMCKKLLALDYTNVRMYEGGLEEWRAAQLPLVTPSGGN